MEPRTLLIIDDNAADRAALIEKIERDGSCAYAIREADCLAEGVRQAEEAYPDCVVLDDCLPDGSGLNFLQRTTQATGRPAFPTVILTDSGSEQSAVALMKAGAQDYLVKADASADAIRLAVNNAIYKTRAERQIEAQRMELVRLYDEARAHNAELRAANTAKDDFLAMLSHELRTPLTPVLSLVSATLYDTQLTADLRETFAIIQRNVELEARLIDDLLDLTQVASGRLGIEQRPVNVHHCIEAALDICQAAFDDKRIAVRTELLAARPMIQGDFARMNQVLWNVLKNAAKFSQPQGRVTICSSNDGSSVVIEVRDEGMGIESERLAGIFGAFSAVKPQPAATGLGLGLAITRAIIEAHRGEIRASSAGKGQGAIFHICLPGITVDAALEEAPARSAGAVARGKTILVVEDHEDTRRVLSRALRRKGFGVTALGSLAAAAEQFAAQPADLLICDLGLPDGTGWDLMDRLRPLGPIRAIAVSGYGMDRDMERSRAAGFVAHLTKPIDFQRLEKLIIETLAQPLAA